MSNIPSSSGSDSSDLEEVKDPLKEVDPSKIAFEFVKMGKWDSYFLGWSALLGFHKC